MISGEAAARARQGAEEAGAQRVETFQRRARARILVLGPGERSLLAIRCEEGLSVRAWQSAASDSPIGFAAGGPGDAPELIGRRAADGWDRRPPPPSAADSARRDDVACGESLDHGAEGATKRPEVAVFDAEILRLNHPEMRRLLERLGDVAAVARRPGLPDSVRAVLRLVAADSVLVRPDGVRRSARTTLASFELRFPTAFGLARLEIASRRLAHLDASPLVSLLAAYPVPGPPPVAVAAALAPDGDHELLLAPPVVATLAARAARRAAVTGRPLTWSAAAVLADDPLLAWGPGSVPFDGDGTDSRSCVLGAPPGHAGGATPLPAVRLAPQRFSVREPPRSAPSNLVLSGVAGGDPGRSGPTLHLLETSGTSADAIVARGVWRQSGADDRAVHVRLEASLEILLEAGARGGPPQPFLVGDGFVSVPQLRVCAAAVRAV